MAELMGVRDSLIGTREHLLLIDGTSRTRKL